MRNCMHEVQHLLKAKIQCIWIETYEENEILKDLREIVSESPGMKLATWTQTEGLKKIALTNKEKQEDANKKVNIDGIFNTIKEAQDSTINDSSLYVLKDLHMIIDTPAIKRYIRDLKESASKNYNPIVVVGPVVSIPLELEKLFTIVHYDTPDKSTIEKLVSRMVASMKDNNEKTNKGYLIPTDEEQHKIVKALLGLTYKEITDTMAKSIVKYKALSLTAIMEEKIQLVEKSGVLDYTVPNVNFEDVGGNNVFKEWVGEVEDAFSDEAQSFGCALPKGYLALGIPGTAKTFLAEAIATKWGVPMLSLNMSKIMNKLVGESEKKIDQAFRIAKACAPCVLLFDEVEKALSGTKSSNASDSGTTARVFSTVLKFLEENNGVFVIMTSNDVTQLPPELTRSGRLDAMWYFSMPTEDERKEIFRIHLGKTGKDISEHVINAAASATKGYTGAEIKDIVKQSMWKAYQRFKVDGIDTLTEDDIVGTVKNIIPISRSSEEKIAMLEDWVRGRALYTNGTTTDSYNTSTDDDLISSVLEELK